MGTAGIAVRQEVETYWNFDHYFSVWSTARLPDSSWMRAQAGMSYIQIWRAKNRYYSQVDNYYKERERLHNQYNEQLENGYIREVTDKEKLEIVANGNPESAAVQAARRVLEKRAARLKENDGL